MSLTADSLITLGTVEFFEIRAYSSSGVNVIGLGQVVYENGQAPYFVNMTAQIEIILKKVARTIYYIYRIFSVDINNHRLTIHN